MDGHTYARTYGLTMLAIVTENSSIHISYIDIFDFIHLFCKVLVYTIPSYILFESRLIHSNLCTTSSIMWVPGPFTLTTKLYPINFKKEALSP